MSAQYSYLENSIDQGVFFTGVGSGSEAFANFFNRSHVYGINGTYGATPTLDLQLLLQQVRSRAAFRPELIAFSATSDTSGVREVTEQDTVISPSPPAPRSASAGGSPARWSTPITTTTRGMPPYSSYNGTVHAVAAYLSAKW